MLTADQPTLPPPLSSRFCNEVAIVQRVPIKRLGDDITLSTFAFRYHDRPCDWVS